MANAEISTNDVLACGTSGIKMCTNKESAERGFPLRSSEGNFSLRTPKARIENVASNFEGPDCES